MSNSDKNNYKYTPVINKEYKIFKKNKEVNIRDLLLQKYNNLFNSSGSTESINFFMDLGLWYENLSDTENNERIYDYLNNGDFTNINTKLNLNSIEPFTVEQSIELKNIYIKNKLKINNKLILLIRREGVKRK